MSMSPSTMAPARRQHPLSQTVQTRYRLAAMSKSAFAPRARVTSPSLPRRSTDVHVRQIQLEALPIREDGRALGPVSAPESATFLILLVTESEVPLQTVSDALPHNGTDPAKFRRWSKTSSAPCDAADTNPPLSLPFSSYLRKTPGFPIDKGQQDRSQRCHTTDFGLFFPSCCFALSSLSRHRPSSER